MIKSRQYSYLTFNICNTIYGVKKAKCNRPNIEKENTIYSLIPREHFQHWLKQKHHLMFTVTGERAAGLSLRHILCFEGEGCTRDTTLQNYSAGGSTF